ncbi:MAG: carboxypeptidase regulatory-like domain-containing protein [Planctomycetes bacterium]|nr:carboxypeptidase regulatory-like domain-containing protein [Planctomycetota bacterium]
MRLRDLLILATLVAVFGGAGLWFTSQESLAVELPPGGPAAAGGEERPPAGSAPATAVSGDHAIPLAADAAARAPRRQDTAGWTHGIVRGDIQLAVSVLDRIQTISVAVEEARRAIAADGSFRNPYRAIVPVRLGAGTPTFEIRDIPFSEFPYIVSVHAPGLNGSRRTVVIDADTPLVDDVVLTISPGSPFSLLLRDQDALPYTGVQVQLVPTGEPHGRRGAVATSDSFGSVVFEDVLAGDYQVRTSVGGQPVGEMQTLTVQPGLGSFQGSAVRGQGHTLTIPRGVPLVVDVADAAGYGVAEALVKATATDRIKLTELEATTDYGGKARFPHLTPGVWQIDVSKDGFQRSHRLVTIQAGQEPPAQQVQLVRLR